jgi:hypothetical protein
MSIVKRNTNWGYAPDYSGQNYTQRFHRQSRITGEWYVTRKRTIPMYDVLAVALGAALLLVVLFV